MPRANRHLDAADPFQAPDPSVYLLGLPRSRSRLGSWGVVAILAGALLALVVILLENYAF